MKKFKSSDFILCAVSGTLFTITFIIPYAGILSWFLLVPFFISIEDKKPSQAIILGTLTGTIVNTLGSYWLAGTLSRFGGFPLVVSLIFLILLSIYTGFSFGIFTYLAAKLDLFNKKGLVSAITISSLWTSIEFLYPYLFPYTISNPQAQYLPVIQISELFGIYSVSFLIVLINVSLFRTIKWSRKKSQLPSVEIITSVLLIIFTILYGLLEIRREDSLISKAHQIKIGMVQSNFDFFEKIEDNSRIISERHKYMSTKLNSPDIIVWPETAIQSWYSIYSDRLIDSGNIEIPNINGAYFIAGGLSYEPKDGNEDNMTNENLKKYNTAFLTDSNGYILDRYNKIKLLLFGEYLPFTNVFPSLQKLSPASGDFIPGNELNLLIIKEKGLKIAPLICYEDIIPSFSRRFADKGANLLVNVTNDAWFGKSFAPYQHLLLSIPRTVETRLFLIRSTNTGISAIIDPVGRVIKKTDIFEQTNLEGEVGLMNRKKTLYTRIGDVFPIFCLFFWVGFAAITKLRGEYFS